MKRIIYIVSVLLVACSTFISCEREDERLPDDSNGGRPIEFVVESEWPEMTKAIINDMSGIKEAGFNVWGSWCQDPNDDSYYTDTQYDVFGKRGTTVIAEENNISEGFQWVCGYEAEWHRGYYNFAATLPAGALEGTQNSSFNKITDMSGTTLKYTSVLTLDLPKNGFDLANSQTDLMYAFSCVDNSKETSEAVKLHFMHAFASLSIRITSAEGQLPVIEEATVYGIHNNIKGQLRYSHEFTHANGESTATIQSNLDYLISEAEITNIDNPYFSVKSNELSYIDSDVLSLVEDLIIFPETLSANCSLKIKIDYKENEDDELLKTVYAEVKEGNWKSGEKYVYLLQI